MDWKSPKCNIYIDFAFWLTLATLLPLYPYPHKCTSGPFVHIFYLSILLPFGITSYVFLPMIKPCISYFSSGWEILRFGINFSPFEFILSSFTLLV